VWRLWEIAIIAKEFGLSPYAVAQELDNDPEQLAHVCLGLLRYAEAKGASDSASKTGNLEMLKPWKGNRLMEQVDQNELDLHRERIARRKAAE